MGLCCLNQRQNHLNYIKQQQDKQNISNPQQDTEQAHSILSLPDQNLEAQDINHNQTQAVSLVEAKVSKITAPYYESVKVQAPKLIVHTYLKCQNNKLHEKIGQLRKINKNLSEKEDHYNQLPIYKSEDWEEDQISNEERLKWGEGSYVNECSLGEASNQGEDDTRYLNEQVDKYPYNCIGLLKGITKIHRLPVFGTAFLIAPNLLLTAAHNIVRKGVLNQNLKFYPMLHGKVADHQEEIGVTQLYFPEGYRDNCDASLDFAILKLNKKVERKKYIMIGQDYPDCSSATIYGYPTDKNNDPFENFFQQYGGKGEITYFEEENIYYKIDTKAGQSGSPVIVEFIKGLYFVIGIHCKFRKSVKLNLGCHLNNNKIKMIKGWMQKMSSESEYSIVDFGKINKAEKYYSGDKIKSNQAIAQIELFLRLINVQKSKNGVSQKLCWLLIEVGKKFRQSGDYEASITFLKESLQVCLKISPEKGKKAAIIKNQIGITSKAQQDYSEALKNYLQAATIFEQLKDDQNIAITFNNIGNCYNNLKLIKQAQKCYQIAFQINQKYFKDHPEKLSIYSTNLAKIYEKNGKLNKAQKLFEQALKIKKNMSKNDIDLCRCYFNLAQCHLNQARLQQDSDSYLKKSIGEHYSAIKILIDLHLTKHQRFAKYIAGFKHSLLQIRKSTKQTIISAFTIESEKKQASHPKGQSK